MQNIQRKGGYFFSIFSVCTKLQRSVTTWGRHGGERRRTTESDILHDPNEVLYGVRHMTHFYYNMLLCVLPVGTLRFDGAAVEQRGVGWVQQYIPEYMTRCSRSDRSQPWLMKPKHFHRCFDTVGSTSSPRPSSTPTLFLVHPSLAPLWRASTCSRSCTVNTVVQLQMSEWVTSFHITLAENHHDSLLVWKTACTDCCLSSKRSSSFRKNPVFRKTFSRWWPKALNLKETGTIHIPPVPSLRLQKTLASLNHRERVQLGRCTPISPPKSPLTQNKYNS